MLNTKVAFVQNLLSTWPTTHLCVEKMTSRVLDSPGLHAEITAAAQVIFFLQ